MTTVAACGTACYGARVCRAKFVERRRRKAAGLTLERERWQPGCQTKRRMTTRAHGSRVARIRRVSTPLSTLCSSQGSNGSVISTRFAASCLLCLLAGSATSLALAAEYYVAPNGNDGNAGTSPAAPWRTIGKANAAVKPGDIVYLRSGKYVNDPIRPGRSGTAGSEIRYVAYPGEQPVLTSNSTSVLKVAIDLTDRSYVVVDGIDVDGVRPGPKAHVDHFVNLYNASYNTISNGTFRYANGWHGIRITYEAHHNRLLDNVIDFVGVYDDGTGHDYGDAIQILRGSHHNLLRGNVITRGAHNLLQVDGPNNVIIENVFENDWSEKEGPGRGGRNLTLMGERNLFERNVVKNALASADEPDNAGMKAEGRWNI